MKLVLDFDEVLFKTKDMREHFTQILERKGVDRRMTELLYMKHRETGIPFSLKRFLWAVAIRTDVREVREPHVYEEILKGCSKFVNTKLVDLVKPFGKEHIIILTNGDKEYQMEKITRSIGEDFAGEIVIVPGSKKEALHSICKAHAHDHIIFVEDQPRFIEDLDAEHIKNLTVVLFGVSGVEDVEEAIKKYSHRKKGAH
jgi:FMN phosphatase YigB (HAD superfamily)